MKTQPLWSKMHAYHQHQGHIQAKRKGRDREGTLLPLETQPEIFLSSFHHPEDSYEASPGSKEAEKHRLGQGTRCLIPNAIPVEGERTMSADQGHSALLPWWLSGKESACQCRRLKFDPWVRKIPWRREW